MNRIAIVSNRLPPPQGQQAAGGLAVGLKAIAEHSGGSWFGWDGTSTPAPSDTLQTWQSAPCTVRGLPLTDSEYAGYYLGFSNKVLWPLLHGRSDLMRFDRCDYATYLAVNRKFARLIAPWLPGHDAVWVHDYHLFMLGQQLRRHGVILPMGFFLHVPFPEPDTLRTLPNQTDFLDALAAYDLVGFQTRHDLHNFYEVVRRHPKGVVHADGSVDFRGRRFRTGTFPIGIDTPRFETLASSEATDRIAERIKATFRDRLGIIGADRLDYTKGLPYRFAAFERLLADDPHSSTNAFFIQVAAPSREAIAEYVQLKAELETMAGRINGRYGQVDWTPLRFLTRSLDQTRLAALYRLSRVGLVTPLVDGMNLVAMEYVAAQSAADPGVLVLSRFAGAAERLDGAVLVNPYDVDALAQAMCSALRMPLVERQSRWRRMIETLRTNTVHRWGERYVEALMGTPRASVAETEAHDRRQALRLVPRPTGAPRPV